ncbi:hypothetical protein FF1_043978 [Malus domestica]
MGRVRTKTVKKSSRQVIERYYSRMTLDFHTNKKILEEVAIIPSKRLRNKIAGFSTHLMKRIQKGPVRGISLKLQEEERERRMDFVPEESAIKTDEISVDKETLDMLSSLGMADMPGVKRVDPEAQTQNLGGFGRGGPRRQGLLLGRCPWLLDDASFCFPSCNPPAESICTTCSQGYLATLPFDGEGGEGVEIGPWAKVERGDERLTQKSQLMSYNVMQLESNRCFRISRIDRGT